MRLSWDLPVSSSPSKPKTMLVLCPPGSLSSAHTGALGPPQPLSAGALCLYLSSLSRGAQGIWTEESQGPAISKLLAQCGIR